MFKVWSIHPCEFPIRGGCVASVKLRPATSRSRRRLAREQLESTLPSVRGFDIRSKKRSSPLFRRQFRSIVSRPTSSFKLQHVAHVRCVRRIGKDHVPESFYGYVRSHGQCEDVYQLVGFWSQEMCTQYAISIFVDQHFEARAILSDSLG